MILELARVSLPLFYLQATIRQSWRRELPCARAQLSKSEFKRLLKVFKEVKEIRFPGILEQLRSKHPYRKHIDKAWLEILGYEGDADELLEGLYESLADEIELLKRIMKERD